MTKQIWTEDEAIEAFNDDMSNSCDDGDRKFSRQLLSQRIGSVDRANSMYDAWMIQYRQSLREAMQ